MSLKVSVCTSLLAICAGGFSAAAQTPAATNQDTASNQGAGTVAYIYLTSTIGSKNQVVGYKAAGNGALSALPGSPFADNINSLAANGAWLFGADSTGQKIDSYAIGANGSLTYKDQYTATLTGGSLYDLFLDHTGSTLYAVYYTTNNDYLSQMIDQVTGQLSFVNDLAGGPANNSAVSFIGNNLFAYSSSCYHFGPEIVGVQRASNGALSYLNDFNPPFPAEKSGGFYCPWLAAADPTNHLVIALTPLNSNWGQDGSIQLAVYTADSAGNLTTTSTYENMPSVLTTTVNTYWMSPSGKYLAVGGTGLQIFRMNGANPITKLTGLLTTDTIDKVYWDNANHLYATSYSSNKLYVFNVTSKGATEAPGSPYTITSPSGLVVLPK
jgi:hypothetical protein